MISLIIPVYNEAASLPQLWERLNAVFQNQSNNSLHPPLRLRGGEGELEVIFINDGSTDSTANLLDELANSSPSVRVLHLSRNFGHQAAISAGLEHATGEAAIILDGDLQDPPELIPELIKKWQEGHDVVYAVRTSRVGESYFKKWSAKLFYHLLNKLSGVHLPPDAGDFRLLSRRVVDHLNQLPEIHRYIRGLSHWLGFRSIGVPYEREARIAGQSKYSFSKLFRLAWDGITAFSFLPLRLATYLGFLTAGGSALYILYALWEKYARGTTVQGWTSLALLVLFLGGVQLIILGIIGEYLGRVFEESKRRPRYIVAKKVGFK